ncbi:hypothetical protein [Moraxella lacunata]
MRCICQSSWFYLLSFIFCVWEKFFPLVKYMLDKYKIFNNKKLVKP